jgi:hypothetical protein
MRGGESTGVLVQVLELVLADGAPSDQALMSSMSETVILFWSNAQGTGIVSDLRWEVDSRLWVLRVPSGDGRVRGEAQEGGQKRGESVMVGGSCFVGMWDLAVDWDGGRWNSRERLAYPAVVGLLYLSATRN